MINWSKAPTFEPVEPGIYECTLTQIKYVPATRGSGNPGIRLDFTLTEPHVEGKKAFATKPLDINGLSFTKEMLVRVGVDPDELAQDMSFARLQTAIEEWNRQFAGQSYRVQLSTYNDKVTGELRQSVDRLMSQFDLA